MSVVKENNIGEIKGIQIIEMLNKIKHKKSKTTFYADENFDFKVINKLKSYIKGES